MPFCPYCSHQVESVHIFCGGCGNVLPAEPSSRLGESQTEERRQTLAYRISPTRILIMTMLSDGLYLFYWFYITWQQYRDHSGNRAFPEWRTLSLIIPIYGFFRTHAHMRCFKKLMLNADVPCSIAVG